MMKVTHYQPSFKKKWDQFNIEAKNGLFLFMRDYMEYHSDRFIDHSLLFFDNSGKLVALFPANIKDDTLVSHGGLTFGGVISDNRMTTPRMLEIFDSLLEYIKRKKLKKLIYKSIPHIYHSIPAEEDLYATFYYNGTLVKRDVSSTINMAQRIRYSKGRKCSINKALKAGVEVQESFDFKNFMDIAEKVIIERHGVRPIHTSEEILFLASHFPKNIRLFTAHLDNNMLGGIIMYISNNVAHTQYMATNDIGLDCGALDIIVQYLIENIFNQIRFFDFGISTEDSGKFLNKGLVSQKEMFGARAVVYDTYEILIKKS